MDRLSIDENNQLRVNGVVIARPNNNYQHELRRQHNIRERALEEMERFCQRVELGEIRSQTTYSAFREILVEAGWRDR